MLRTNGLVCYALFLLPITAPLQAASVFRCEDSSGHISFTLQGCPAEQRMEIQSAENPSPGSGAPVSMALKAKSSKGATGKPKSAKDLTIVAEQQDGCGNRVTGPQRRTAIIRQQIQAGMTQGDVESALGKPDEQSMVNGDTQYLYTADNGTRRKVSFDQNGCVKSKH